MWENKENRAMSENEKIEVGRIYSTPGFVKGTEAAFIFEPFLGVKIIYAPNEYFPYYIGVEEHLFKIMKKEFYNFLYYNEKGQHVGGVERNNKFVTNLDLCLNKASG